MWETVHGPGKKNQNFVTLAADLFAEASHKLIVTTTVICGFWLIGLATYRSGYVSVEILPLMVSLTLTTLISLYFLSKKLVAAQMVWLAGFYLTTTLAIGIFKNAELAFLYAILPLMAMVMIGWKAAVFQGILIGAGLLGLSSWFGEVPFSAAQIWMILLCSTIAGGIGWATYSPFVTMLEWSNDSYRSAAKNLEEARNQRIELSQVQEDLIQANTELGRLSQRLKAMTEKAEEARQIKEEFVARVSHELRTPLNMIIGYTDLIMKSPQVYSKRLPVRLLADISSVQRNSQHLVELINDVLDLSQVDAGRMVLSKRWISINDLIEESVLAVKQLFDTKNLYLNINLPDHPVVIYCDNTRIREVILNLLSNAGRYTETGGVVVSVIEEDDNIAVSVKDTGPGISNEDQGKIFEPFSQLDSMLHHRIGNSGLGLSISKRFVELHDGKMWFTSQVGIGTTFSFKIPTGITTVDPDVQKSSMRWVNPYVEYVPRLRPFKAPKPRFMPRLVIVEKDRALQRLFSHYTDKVEIITYESVEDALKQINEHPVQGVILNMPLQENEQQAFARIPFHTPLITCWIPGREEANRRLGVVEYILKPVRQDDILSTLDKFGKKNLNLLIVDDDLETLQLFARIISINRPGYQVIRASSGREALDLMRARQPEAVLLDLILPDLDGYQVLREKAGDPFISGIPVVIVSSDDPVGVQVISSQFGVHRPSGLSVQEFLDSILALVGVLNSESNTRDPEPQGTSPELPA